MKFIDAPHFLKESSPFLLLSHKQTTCVRPNKLLDSFYMKYITAEQIAGSQGKSFPQQQQQENEGEVSSSGLISVTLSRPEHLLNVNFKTYPHYSSITIGFVSGFFGVRTWCPFL